MNDPEISVIIPAYNAEKYIEKCLHSLKKQTFRDFEIIVVDDGSRDKTWEIASKYAKAIKSDINLGEGAARNLGAREARGRVLAFSDADVVFSDDWLSNIVNDMGIHNVKCVGGGYKGTIGNSFMEKFAHLELIYRRRNMPKFVNTIVSNNFACYRDVFLECGGFPEKYKCEDLRLSFEISKKNMIFWDKDNGVFHHFRPSLKAYLKQQYYFGRDTVWTYYHYPQLLLKQTHQGTGIYLDTILMFFTIVSLAFFPIASPIFLSLILILNSRFLTFLKRDGMSVSLSLPVILLRDTICVISIFSGIGLCLKDIARLVQKRYV